MKQNIALILFLTTFYAQAESEPLKKIDGTEAFNMEYIKAIESIDKKEYCFYEDYIYSKNSIVDMSGVLMKCGYDGFSGMDIPLTWLHLEEK